MVTDVKLEENSNFDAILTRAFISTTIITSLIIIFVRYGLDNNVFKIINLILIPIVGIYIALKINCNSKIKKIVITILSILIIPLVINKIFINILTLIIIIEIIIKNKRINFNNYKINEILVSILISIFIVTNQINIFSGTNIFGPEFSKLGWYSTSAYFHVSIVEIIKYKNLITSGIDGYSHLNYHVYSHIWFSRVAEIFEFTGFEVYAFAYQIIIVPLFFLGAMLCLKYVINLKSIITWTIYSLLIILYLSIFPSLAFESESFLFGFLFFLVTLFIYLENKKYNIYVLNLMITLILFLTYLSKLSTGIILTLTILSIIIRNYKNYRKISIIAILTNVTITSLILIIVANTGVEILSINLLNYSYVLSKINIASVDEIKFMPFYNFLFSYNVTDSIRAIIVSIISIILLRKYESNKEKIKIFSTIIIIGILMAATDIARENSVYFSHLSELISIFIICSYISISLSNNLNLIKIQFFIFFIVLTILTKYLFGFMNIIDSIYHIRLSANFSNQNDIRLQYQKIMINWFLSQNQREILVKNIDDNALSKFSTKLKEYRDNNLYNIEAVYITFEAQEYIKNQMNKTTPPKKIMQYLPRKCSENYLVQSLSGMPIIYSVNLDPKNICNKLIFGFKNFKYSERKIMSNHELCTKSKSKKIDNILFINILNSELNYSVINCKKII
jgi:hypothetical protein